MPLEKKAEGPEGDSPTGGLPSDERKEELLRSLSDFTRLRPNDRSLSPDFRLQLQLLECSVQQHRLLQQVADQQRRAAAQIEALHCTREQSQAALQQRLDEVLQTLEQAGQLAGPDCPPGRQLSPQDPFARSRQVSGGSLARSPSNIMLREAAAGMISEAPSLPSPTATEAAGHPEEQAVRRFQSTPQTSSIFLNMLTDNHRESGSPKCLKKAESKASLVDEGPIHRIVKGPRFEIICGVIIICNAATMGFSTNATMTFRSANPGNADPVPIPEFIRMLGYFYCSFYVTEIILKMFVFGRAFIFSDQWKWNLFDVILVLVGIYDIVADMIFPSSSNSNVSWMRMLRLLRMMKMLRVVRVMRIFRVLRMMLNSIAGSMMTLMWSILMLSLMMYVFSLCFLQIISGYLSDTPSGEIDDETVDLARMYWGSVYQGIITLYYAVTGGADWEPLAMPVRAAGEAYYMLFLFYIAFTAFAVLNVLTGLYVDTATKIADRDDESVGEELYQREETQAFMGFLEGQPGKEDSTQMCLRDLEANLQAEPVKEFFKMTELTPADCRRIFRMLDFDSSGSISIGEFIGGCLHSKCASQSLDMLALMSETKRSIDTQTTFNAFVEEKFEVLTRMLSHGLRGGRAVSEAGTKGGAVSEAGAK